MRGTVAVVTPRDFRYAMRVAVSGAKRYRSALKTPRGVPLYDPWISLDVYAGAVRLTSGSPYDGHHYASITSASIEVQQTEVIGSSASMLLSTASAQQVLSTPRGTGQDWEYLYISHNGIATRSGEAVASCVGLTRKERVLRPSASDEVGLQAYAVDPDIFRAISPDTIRFRGEVPQVLFRNDPKEPGRVIIRAGRATIRTLNDESERWVT